MAKNPINAKKVKCDGETDQRTDGRTDKAGCRVAQHATKNLFFYFLYCVYGRTDGRGNGWTTEDEEDTKELKIT